MFFVMLYIRNYPRNRFEIQSLPHGGKELIYCFLHKSLNRQSMFFR
jgi:hypothetical protein